MAEHGEILAAAYCQSGQANCLFRRGAIALAPALYERTLEIYQQFSAYHGIAWSLWNWAHVAALTADNVGTERLLTATLTSFHTYHDTTDVAAYASTMAGI